MAIRHDGQAEKVSRSILTWREGRLEWRLGGLPVPAASPFIRHGLTRAMCFAFAVGVVGAFLLFVASAIASEGVCCADDGIYATMAKNLAGGLGFSTTLQADNSRFRLMPFDPQAGGPSVVVPAAVLVKLFGNQYWVPGLAGALLWLACFAGCGLLLWSYLDSAPASVAAGLFFGFVFALFPYHFEHWYALLGEVPASALILLGALMWALSPDEPRRLALVGTALSLAVLSKALALLWLGVILGAAGVHGWRSRPARRKWWVAPAIMSLGVGVPVGLFEVWKLVALGWNGYCKIQEAAVSFLAFRGVARGGAEGPFARALANSEAFRERFGLPIGIFVLAAALGAGFVWLRGSAEFRRIGAVLLGGLAVHTSWWLTVSDGRPRYMVMALIPAAFLICLPVGMARSFRELLGMALAVALLSTPTWGRLAYPVGRIQVGRFEASERNRHGLEVTRFLEREAAGKTVFTEWWAMVSALDYESKTRIQFQPLGAAAARDPREVFFVVVDDRFLNWSGQNVGPLVAPCGPPVLNRAPYRVFDCR